MSDAPSEVDRIGEFERVACAGAFVEHRRREAGAPNLPAGSAAAPDLTIRLTSTTGTSCISTIQTGRPFDSVCFWMAGSFRAGAGPGAGGFDRSGACCAWSAGRCHRDGDDAAADGGRRVATRRGRDGVAVMTGLTSWPVTRRRRHDRQFEPPVGGQPPAHGGLNVGRRAAPDIGRGPRRSSRGCPVAMKYAFIWSALPATVSIWPKNEASMPFRTRSTSRASGGACRSFSSSSSMTA